jgi:hypothetical protein
MPDRDLRRFWFEFDARDRHGCDLPSQCGVTAWNELDALTLVAESYCEKDELPSPNTSIHDIDVSKLHDPHIRPNIGVPVWRGIWYPFLTRM